MPFTDGGDFFLEEIDPLEEDSRFNDEEPFAKIPDETLIRKHVLVNGGNPKTWNYCGRIQSWQPVIKLYQTDRAIDIEYVKLKKEPYMLLTDLELSQLNIFGGNTNAKI